MTKKPCHLGRTYDPNCVGCEAVNDEKSINYMHIARTVGCAHCNSQLASLPDGIKCVCICHDEKPKCCDECYSTYTEKTYPMHTVYDACINQVCKCHDEKQTNSEISLHSGKDTNYLSAPQEESNVEHCDEPSCPECNTAAYERGRKDEHERVVKEALAYMQRCLLWSKGTVEGTRNDLIAKTANHFGITLSEADEGKKS